MTPQAPTLAAVLFAAMLLPTATADPPIVCDFVQDTCQDLPEVCEDECLPSCDDDCVPDCQRLGDCVPPAPDCLPLDECVPPVPDCTPPNEGEVCGMPVPEPGADPLPPEVDTQCVFPYVCDYCYPSAVTQLFQDSEDTPTCEAPIPGAEPCLDNPVECIVREARNADDNCNTMTKVGDFRNAGVSSAELYAKRVLPETYGTPPGGFGVAASGFRYDIYAGWGMQGETIQVGAKHYPIGFSLSWGPGYGMHSAVAEKSQKASNCYLIGRIDGTEFQSSVRGGAAGVMGSSSCSWEVSASYSISEGVTLTAGPQPGASTTLTQTVTIGGSAGCTDGAVWDSEVLLESEHQDFTVPPWTT